jgi:hypothetical protein
MGEDEALAAAIFATSRDQKPWWGKKYEWMMW